MRKKILIVGAGFTGAVIARQLAEAGYDIDVIDSRLYVGGNCFTERDSETNVMVHVHGPHIFHTDNEEVWSYVNKYAELRPYILRVKATVQNSVYGLPINLHTINQFFGKTFSPKDAKEFLKKISVDGMTDPESFEDQALRFLGNDLYQAFFFGYPMKQWGLHPTKLPASILKRLPVRFSYDDNYFAHKYQGIPVNGYSALIEKILCHERISVSLGVALDKAGIERYDHVFYSGPLDGWYDYEMGRLGYRTLRFEREVHDGDFQGCAVMSYPDSEIPYTRITEHKHFAPWETHEKTVVFKEYSSQSSPGDIEYYPIRLVQEQKMLQQYSARALRETKVSFVGRLGTYRYLDMDVTVKEALEAASKFLELDSKSQPIPAMFVEV